MAEKADETTVRYHRRLDRTPEKHFEKLLDGEKKLMCAMRGALENCKNKVVEMKDDIAEKEKTIEEEVGRRKEAEKRLRQYLVDPYGSPEVNSELRSRLPRAGKTDLVQGATQIIESSDESDGEEVVVKSRASRNNAESPFSMNPWSSLSSVGVAPPGYGPREGQTTAPRQGIPLSRSYPLLSGEQVAGGEAGLFGGGLGEMAQSAATEAHGASANPPTTPAQSFPAAANAANAANQSAPAAESQGPRAQKSALPSEHNPAAQKQELFSQSASSMASSHYALPASLPTEAGVVGERYRALFPPFGGGPLNVNGVGSAGELSPRQSSVLQEEIGRLRKANQELREKLSLCTVEVEGLRLQILTDSPGDGSLDADAAGKLADLMSEIRTAEKRREETMEARIRQAERDREELILDFERSLLRTGADRGRSGRRLAMRDMSSSSESEDSDDEEEDEELEVVKGVKAGHSAYQTERAADAGRVMSLKDALRELERRQETERQLYQEEMAVVMEQRDQAVQQTKLSALHREKDRAESLALRLKEELVDRNLYISLHKALFADSALNDYDKTTRDPGDCKLRKKIADDNDDDKNVDKGPVKEDNQLLDQLRRANQERSLLKSRCEELEAVCKQEKEEKNRLERLNGVLRRKLIAASSSGSQEE
ncbi:hypothetical protein ACOMHN_066135 [Nucella lapillus]